MRTVAFGLVLALGLSGVMSAMGCAVEAGDPPSEAQKDGLKHDIGTSGPSGQTGTGSGSAAGGIARTINDPKPAGTDKGAPQPEPWMAPQPEPWSPKGGASGGTHNSPADPHAKQRESLQFDQP